MRWQKMALLVLRRVGLCIGQNQMCLLCGWLFTLTHNVLQLGEVAEIEAQMFSFEQKFNRRTKLEFSTEPAILPNCCYLLCFFLLYIFNYEFNDFVFTLLNKFFCPSCTFRSHFLYFSLLFQMVVTIAFVSKWFVTN